jgi:hypothetical protein
MSEGLGKIEKPLVEDYKGGRRLFFIPLVLTTPDIPQEFLDKTARYWDQVESQISGLELKLGNVNRIYHELIPETGEKAVQQLDQLKIGSLPIVKSRVERGASFEALEDNDILTELMDWSRCLSLGLQSQKVFGKIYDFYTEVNNRRTTSIIKKIDETLKENEISIVVMAEGSKIQFPQDMKVFYIAPPALDDIKRWLRDYQAKEKESECHDENCQEEHQH